MSRAITQDDIAEMLAALAGSGFARLDLRHGDTRVAASRADGPAATDEADVAGTVVVASPRIGVFEAEALPAVGERLAAGAVVGQIRTRRATAPVKAGQAGAVAALLVRPGAFVEYGQALLRLRPLSEGRR